MKDKIINFWINKIRNSNQYSEDKIAEIKYGLESIYLTVTKLVVICLVAIILKIFKELIIFLALYNLARIPSFGLHANKSWICLLSSLIIFIIAPIICTIIYIPIYFKSIVGIILIYLYYKWAPADTKKRPIINQKRRLLYKILSVSIVSIFSILSLCITDTFISNSLITCLIIQAIIISPWTYKLFNLPYDNYKSYLQTV